MDLLKIGHVSKAYSGHQALSDVSLSIPEGTVYGLLGPNGAGKTTLIRIINHITMPDAGTVYLNGKPLTEDDVVNIGYLPEERGLYRKMKVGEQAVFFARLKGMSRSDAVAQLRYWFEKFNILNWWNRKVEELSKGMAQKVQFIITVVHRPKLLIFDEPFSGFDPINVNLLKEEILNLKNEGATVIFSTHNMSSVEEICDNITLINKSRNILSGNVDEIRRQFFHNYFDLTFEGELQDAYAALQPVADDIRVLEKDSRGRNQLSLHLKDGASMRDLVAVANDAVNLYGFKETMASMNDIFIRAVAEDSQNNQQNS